MIQLSLLEQRLAPEVVREGIQRCREALAAARERKS